MIKQMKIDGMSCSHCVNAVTAALGVIEGVQATVSLEEGIATVTMEREVPDQTLIDAVTDEGYIVKSVWEE